MNKIDSNYSDHPIRKWIIGQSLNHSWRIIIISILSTIFFSTGALFFIIDDDILKLLPKDIPSRVIWDDIQDEFGSTEVIFIAFGKSGEGALNEEILATLWDLTSELNSDQLIEDVISISNTTRIDNNEGFIEVNDLQKNRLLSEDQIKKIDEYLVKNPAIRKRLLSKNGEFVVATVQPYENIGYDIIRNRIVEIADNIIDGLDVYYGGQAYISGTMPALLQADSIELVQVGMVIMVLILLVNLRSFSGLLMVLSVILPSLISMIGFMGWMYKFTGADRFLFTFANTSMPIVLLTIANSDGVHVVSKFFKEMRKFKDPNRSVISTMDALIVPIFLTSITTISAFLLMITSPIEAFRGYGIVIAFGIFWAGFLSSFLLPALLKMKNWNLNSSAFTKPSFFEKIIKVFGRFILSYPRYVFASGLVFVVFGIIGFTKISVDVNMNKFFPPGTEIGDSMDFMDDQLTGTVDVRVKVNADMKDPETLSKMMKLQDFMEKNEKLSISYSIGNIVEQMHRTMMDDNPIYETIPDTKGKVNNLFTMYSMSGDPEDFDSLIDYDYQSGLVTGFASVMSTEEIFEYSNSLKNYIEKNFPENISLKISGMIIIFRDLVMLIIKSSALSIIASLVVIGLIAWIAFKKALWGILAIMPLSAAIIINFGLMGYFGIELSHITAILSSIIIGVGVDFSIHYIAQFRRLSRTTKQEKLSIEVMEDVGYPIILDASSNMGLGSLLFSTFVPLQYLGGLMVFAMFSTSFGALTILSASAEIMKSKLIEREIR